MLLLEDVKKNKTAPALGNVLSTPDSDLGLCWICMDNTKNEPLLSKVCLCTNRQAHKSCLHKWYHYSRERQEGLPASCPACRYVYQHIDLESPPQPENTATKKDRFRLLSLLFQTRITLTWQLILLFLGFCYGIVCKSIPKHADADIYIAATFNCAVGVVWFFAPTHQLQRCFWLQNLCADVFLLGSAYVLFLVGCFFASLAGLIAVYSLRSNLSLVIHAINFFCYVVFIGGRTILINQRYIRHNRALER